jgi:hypothetical protein
MSCGRDLVQTALAQCSPLQYDNDSRMQNQREKEEVRRCTDEDEGRNHKSHRIVFQPPS